MLLREIRVVNLLPKAQISISGANFSAVETEADFFNRIGQNRSLDSRTLIVENEPGTQRPMAISNTKGWFRPQDSRGST